MAVAYRVVSGTYSCWLVGSPQPAAARRVVVDPSCAQQLGCSSGLLRIPCMNDHLARRLLASSPMVWSSIPSSHTALLSPRRQHTRSIPDWYEAWMVEGKCYE